VSQFVCSFQTTFASMSTNTKLQQGYRKAKNSANRVGQKLLARFRRSSAAGTGKTAVSWPLKSKRSSKTDAEATAHRYIELYRSQQAGFDLWTVRKLPLLLSPHKVVVSSTWSGSTTKAAAFLAWCPRAGSSLPAMLAKWCRRRLRTLVLQRLTTHVHI